MWIFFTRCPNKIIIHIEKNYFLWLLQWQKNCHQNSFCIFFWLFTGSFPKRFFKKLTSIFLEEYIIFFFFFSNFHCSMEAEIFGIAKRGTVTPQKRTKVSLNLQLQTWVAPLNVSSFKILIFWFNGWFNMRRTYKSILSKKFWMNSTKKKRYK